MALYRTAFLAYLTLVLLPALLWRRLRGREGRTDLAQRFAREQTSPAVADAVANPAASAAAPPVARPAGSSAAPPAAQARTSAAASPPAPAAAPLPVLPARRLWLHGASVGELTSARPLAEALLARDPTLHLVVTANTVTGRDSVAGWGDKRVEARLAPLDTRSAVRRFLDLWQPLALVQLEKELWPERMTQARRRGLPVVQAAALLSPRSAAGWGRFPGLARQVLGVLDAVAAQDAATEARLLALGLSPERLGPRLSLKAAAALPAPDPQALAALAAVLPRATTFLAASTHPGEEEPVLDAFAAARRGQPGLRLILAPRHPERGAELARLLAARGLLFARRALGEPPRPAAPVYLADTLGEMGLWFRLAQVAFVGGSLVEKGGHTPYEPARLGCAILHGPHVGNNAAAYAALDACGGALQVRDAAELGAALQRLARAPAEAAALARRARAALAQDRAAEQAIEGFAERLLARLPPSPPPPSPLPPSQA